MRSAALLVLLVFFGLAATGCGSAKEPSGSREGSGQSVSGGQGKEISADDAAKVQDAERTVIAACGDGQTSPQGTQATDRHAIPSAVGTLLQVLRDNGTSDVYETGNVDRAKQLKDVTSDLAGQLRRCRAPDQATRLQQALGAKG